MGSFYVVVVGLLLVWAFILGWIAGAYRMSRKRLSQPVSLSDFSKLTRSR